MARRCKLISPTNLLLETPILSPVAECEYVLCGANEHAQELRYQFKVGAAIGFVGGMALAALIAVIAQAFVR